jgi:pyruvate dehydrogenase E1 component alpha subunit
LIECKTYRHSGHSRFEKANYRTNEELQAWLKRDPIPRFEEWLFEEQALTPEDCEHVRRQIEAELQEAVAFARQSSQPPADAALRYVYASDTDTSSP